jgi:hypothetical protein
MANVFEHVVEEQRKQRGLPGAVNPYRLKVSAAVVQ